MNNTKWEELRRGMYALGKSAPKFQVKDRDATELSQWDSEWFYHFRGAGFDTIEWVDIQTSTPEQRDAVRDCLRTIRVPGIETESGFRIFGWVASGTPLEYIA